MTKARYSKLIAKDIIKKSNVVGSFADLDDSVKKNLVLRLYYSGSSMFKICNTLFISQKILSKWIINDSGGNTRRIAIKMYLHGCSKDKICYELDIKMPKLKSWLDVLYETEYNKPNQRPNIQDGFSHWVSKIIDKHRRRANYKAVEN